MMTFPCQIFFLIENHASLPALVWLWLHLQPLRIQLNVFPDIPNILCSNAVYLGLMIAFLKINYNFEPAVHSKLKTT
jgi:hypothetical protein